MSDLHKTYETLLRRGMPRFDGVDFFGLDYHELKCERVGDRDVWYIEDVECDLYGDDVQKAIKPQERVLMPRIWVEAILTMHALRWAQNALDNHYWWSSEGGRHGQGLHDLMICKVQDEVPLHVVVADASEGIIDAILAATEHLEREAK